MRPLCSLLSLATMAQNNVYGNPGAWVQQTDWAIANRRTFGFYSCERRSRDRARAAQDRKWASISGGRRGSCKSSCDDIDTSS